MRAVPCSALALVCIATRALAAPPDESPRVSEATVNRLSVVLVGDANGPELGSLIEEWLEPTGLRVEVQAQRALSVDEVLASDPTERRVRVWVTATPKHVRIYMADRGAEHFLVRDVPLEHGLNEVGREQVTQVLLSAAIAFMQKREQTSAAAVRSALEGSPAAPAEPEHKPAPPERPPERSPASPTVLRGSIGARYLSRYAGPEGLVHGPGVSGEVGVAWGPVGLSLLAEVHGELPHRANGRRLELVIAGFSARAGLRAAVLGPSGHVTALEVAAGLSVLSIDAETGSASDVRPRATSDRRPSLGLALLHGLPVGPLRLVLGLSVDVDLVRIDYAVLLDGRSERELSPWQAQPGAFAGVEWP